RVLATLATSAAAPSVDLSPDGRTLAILWADELFPVNSGKLHIARVSLDGSDFREILTLTDHIGVGTVAWDPDGRSILFEHKGVMRVPADGGGQPTLVFDGRGMDRVDFDVSRDGSRIVYRSNEGATTLWALDNILPTLK